MGALAILLPVLGPILDKVLGSVLPDPAARAKAVGEIFGQLQSADLAQLDVNKVEAASSSLFVAGWRPACGWLCVTALGYQYILVPIAMWVSFVIGKPLPKPPTLDSGLYELLIGMLGLGAMRSFEKIKGVVK